MHQMPNKPLKSRIFPLAVAAVIVAPATALAWSQRADFETHIHGHEFSRVTLDSNECELKVRLFFDAPEAAYKNESPARNYYRFHARIKLDDGRGIITRVFYNTAPGARAYTYVDDTKPDSCFAKQEHKIQGVDIEGCRGAGCTPEPFK
jgi:hypothetical protein